MVPGFHGVAPCTAGLRTINRDMSVRVAAGSAESGSTATAREVSVRVDAGVVRVAALLTVSPPSTPNSRGEFAVDIRSVGIPGR